MGVALLLIMATLYLIFPCRYLSFSISFYLFIYLSICLSFSISFYLFIFLSIRLSFFLSIYHFIIVLIDSSILLKLYILLSSWEVSYYSYIDWINIYHSKKIELSIMATFYLIFPCRHFSIYLSFYRSIYRFIYIFLSF